jgi:antitoxin ParD1/3/4
MTTISISLPEDMKEFLEAQVAEGGYASAGEYLQALIRDARRSKAKRDLIAKLDEALASGPAEPMTREDWDALERKVWERHESNQPSPPSRP